MSTEQSVTPDLLGLLGAVLISVVSGFISISQRIVRGHEASLLWVTSEFMSAILCGYLVYNLYPYIANDLPTWLTQPILVAAASHFGGKAIEGFERLLAAKYGLPLGKGGTGNDRQRR